MCKYLIKYWQEYKCKNYKHIFCNVLMLISVIFVFNLSNTFDWKYYLEYYSDLRNVGIATHDVALKHFFLHGIKEGRTSVENQIDNTNFDWKYYIKINNLKNLNSHEEALKHYQETGYFKNFEYCKKFKISIFLHLEDINQLDEFIHRINNFLKYNNKNNFDIKINIPLNDEIFKFNKFENFTILNNQNQKTLNSMIGLNLVKSKNRIKILGIINYIKKNLNIDTEKIQFIISKKNTRNGIGFVSFLDQLIKQNLNPDFIIRLHTDKNEVSRDISLSFLNIHINKLLNSKKYIYSNKISTNFLKVYNLIFLLKVANLFKINLDKSSFNYSKSSMFIISNHALDLFKKCNRAKLCNLLDDKIEVESIKKNDKFNEFLGYMFDSLNLNTHLLEFYPRKYTEDNFLITSEKEYIYNRKLIKKYIKNFNIKLMAYYFPQFHECKENNRFWGKNFTEWTLMNNYKGEMKKPHIDIGQYNMLDLSTRKKQAIIAKKHGIDSFNYYHYWFKDRPVMNEGIEKILEDNEPNIPFVLTWDNHSWVRTWTGHESGEVLIKQEYGIKDDWLKHYQFLLRFFKHPNYIKEDNCPLFFIWRLDDIEKSNALEMLTFWNEIIKKDGFNGIKIISTNMIDKRFFIDFNKINSIVDGFAEMQPGMYLNIPGLYSDRSHKYNPSGEITKFKFNDFLQATLAKLKPHNKHYWSIMYGFENSSRRIGDMPKAKFINLSYKNFEKQIIEFIKKIANNPNQSTNYLLLNSWNEWTEQAMVEPNDHDGYEILKVIKRIFKEKRNG